jgi:hypothetical protein
MEQQFLNTLQQLGWLAAIETHQMPTEFWIQNFKVIPNDNVIRNRILDYQKLEEHFLAHAIKQGWFEGFGYVNWGVISASQELSEDFIRKFKDQLDWELICIHQKLSESFIEEFSDRVDWYSIGWRQNISKEFVYRHLDKLDSSTFSRNIYGPIKL